MSHLVLYRKYRPQKFSEITGQEHIVKTILNQIKFGDIAHGYLFGGPRGVGKTTIARLVAKSLNCENREDGGEPCDKCVSCVEVSQGRSLDLIEIDAASNRGIDEIRELREKIRFTPTKGKYKIYIIDEVHMLTKEAFNALLKTLEEPPAHAVFVLATTEMSKIPPTIISRTQRFDFKKLSVDEIVEKLKEISKKEKIQIDTKSLEIIALNAEGGMRDAASLLGQVMSVEDKKITLEEVELILGKSSQDSIVRLVDLMIQKDIRQSIMLVNTITEDGFDLNRFTKELIDYLRKIVLAKIDGQQDTLDVILKNNLTNDQIKRLKEQGQQFDISFLAKSIKLFSGANAFSSVFPQLGLELALVELLSGDENSGLSGKNISSPGPVSESSNQQARPMGSYSLPNSSRAGYHIKDKGRPFGKEENKNISQEVSSSEPGETSLDVRNSFQDNPKDDLLPGEMKNGGVSDESTELLLQEMKSGWGELVAAVKPKNYTAAAFLKQCVPLGHKDGNWYIATKFDFHKERLGEAKTRYAIEEVFGEKMKQKIVLRFVNEQEANKIGFNISLEDKNEKVVTDALNILGGEMVE